MATTKISTGVLKDGSVTSAKLDTNISIVGDLTVDTNTLFVDSASNRVGIGTSSPTTPIHILSSTDIATFESSTTGLYNTYKNSNKVFGYVGTGSQTVSGGGVNDFGIQSSDNFLIATGGNVERMRIDSAGNVGIGTSSPNSNLVVNGSSNVRVNLEAGNIRYGTIFADNGILALASITSIPLVFATNDTERMRIASNGNVGIGTTDPDAILHTNISFGTSAIFGATNTGAGASNEIIVVGGSNTNQGLLLKQNGISNTSFGAVSYIYNQNNAAMLFGTNNTERMRITNTGNVGIGTSSPARIVHIADPSVAAIQLENTSEADSFIDFMNPSRTFRVGYDDSADVFKVAVTNFNNNSLVVNSAGNVGIGTSSPARPLHISSSVPAIRLQDTDVSGLYHEMLSTAAGEFQFNADKDNVQADSKFTFAIDGSEKMRLESDGDLHVDGDVIAYSTTISDERLKDDIQTIDNALDKVSNLRGVSYTWNNGNRKGQKDLGLIAQEVEQVLPELVREKEMPMIDGGTYKTVDYEKIVGVLIEAVKELKNEIESLKSK